MLYDLRLVISYHYGGPVAGGRHLLRLWPREIPGLQHVQAAEIAIAPAPAESFDRPDFFGNRMTGAVIAADHDGLEVTLRARIERLAPPPLADVSPALADMAEEIAGQLSLGPEAPAHFLGPSPRIGALPEIRDWVADLGLAGLSALGAALAVNRAIHAAMRYESGSTTVDTPLAEAFAARRGVCQDFSHVMIAALREIGLPAAYVSGLLRTEPPPGQPRLEGADAMHAWVAVWCGAEMGWVELDPTNAIPAGQDHVVIARGRDYSDVSPVRGVLRMSGSQSGRQAVDLIPLE